MTWIDDAETGALRLAARAVRMNATFWGLVLAETLKRHQPKVIAPSKSTSRPVR